MIVYLHLLKKARRLCFLLTTLLFLIPGNFLFAEGSKDLYPDGKTGRRAYLRAHNVSNANWPFANHGAHYVYAKIGERISIASSAQGLGGNARIRLYDPTENLIINNTTGGNISNRAAELAGPLLFGESANGGKYAGLTHLVTVEGIYRVEFVARGTGDPSTSYNATAAWSEANDAGIRAWDVSVMNTANNGFETGRVYTNVLNLSTGTNSPNTTGFFGLVYVLTKDGYTYRVNNNGNNGMYFTFMVNNNGFLEPATGNPLYKSLNTTSFGSNAVHNPNSADTSKQITHKIFYTLPNPNLPSSSIGAVPDGNTWLKNSIIEAVATDVKITGVDGTEGQMGTKGGIIHFTTTSQGSYKVIIESGNVPADFEPKILSGIATVGVNEVEWDGTDGLGQDLPEGNVPIRVIVELTGAEVHFPFFDMEYNRFGTIVELMNHENLNQVKSDIVYWNDADISSTLNGSMPSPLNNSHLPPANSVGISSNLNGHIWGVGGTGTSGQFGDNRSIDTWTFIKGDLTEINSTLTVNIADLKITELTVNSSTVSLGETISVQVKAKNDGPSAAPGSVFQIFLPAGLEPENIQFLPNNCGIEMESLEYNPLTNSLVSLLDLPVDCEIGYTFDLKVWDSFDTGNSEIIATILRPNDFTDPDATNPDRLIPPTDPFYECANNGIGGQCNNITRLNLVYNATANCINLVNAHSFEWQMVNQPSGQMEEVILHTPSDLGYSIDFYKVNHSFQVLVNQNSISSMDLQFKNTNGFISNVRFADGDQYGVHTTHNGVTVPIWEMEGTEENPLIRLRITPAGQVYLYGSKTSGGELFPLVLEGGNEWSMVNWMDGVVNEISIRQNQSVDLELSGNGYGLEAFRCPCVKPGNQGEPLSFGDVGILTKNSSDMQWPKNVPNGYLVMDGSHRGFVVNHLTTIQRNLLEPIEGMIIYNTDLGCVQLYRGMSPSRNESRTGWNCIEKSCND